MVEDASPLGSTQAARDLQTQIDGVKWIGSVLACICTSYPSSAPLLALLVLLSGDTICLLVQTSSRA